MNLFTLSSILVFLTSLSMGIFVFWRGRDKRVKNIWGWFCFVNTVWGIGGWLISVTSSKEKAFLFWQISETGIIFIPILYFHFIYALTNLQKKKQLLVVYLLGIIFLGFDILAKDVYIGKLKLLFGQFYFIDLTHFTNWVYLLFYILFYWILLPYSFLLLIIHYVKSSAARKAQLKYFILGSIIGWIGGHGNFLPKFLNVYPHSNFLIALYPPIITYAILKHRLLDIRVAVTRIGIFFVVYALVLGLPFWVGYRTGLWIWALAFMSVLATVGPFIYTYLRQRAEDVILKTQRRYQKNLKVFVKEVAQIRDIDTLFETISRRISRIINSEFLAIYVFSKEDNRYVLKQKYAKASLKIKTEKRSFRESIPANASVVKALSQDKKITFFELIKDSNFPDTPHETLAIPFIVNEGLFSFLILGPKLSKAMYNQEDLEAFEILSGQASLAIENCIFWQEEKTRIMKEEQIRRMQTMDHFSASMAHEIDNLSLPVSAGWTKRLLCNKSFSQS